MAESIMRKIQPFTIGTKLSVPAVPKCPHFAESYLPGQALDNCKLQHNLNDQVSLYLGRAQMRPDGPRFSPVAAQVTRVERRQVEMAEEDHLNRNGASPTAFSRSIRKITISGSTVHPLGACPKSQGTPGSENVNNNNNVAPKPLPKIIGVSCEHKPNSHFKVLLRKDGSMGEQNNDSEGASGTDCTSSTFQTPVLSVRSPNQEQKKGEDTPCGHAEALLPNDCCFSQRRALFNREILQAEAWIKGKLQELRDGCNAQRRPLQEEQTLQRDLKDFENTLIQLNQMGEQLVCKLNPTADLVRKQLGQLKDQWHTLKQTAASQSKALGGARSLLEFNRKVDRLEVWIKEKEEEQWLAKFQGENMDRMQLTRRILDLKEDEQLYRTLHEEINHLALKLEKQGKTEGKTISTRKKHINKMWLKVQSLLKDYHENLQLALEISSFYQQADNIICAINNKRKSACVRNEQENSGDREVRDIASQVMMLDVTVSQLSKLHPALALRVTQKQGEVKDGWALLQKAVRNEKPPATSPDFTREDSDPLTPSREPQCSVGAEIQRIMGKEFKEEQNRLKGCVSMGDPGTNRKLAKHQEDEMQLKSHASSVAGSSSTHADNVAGRRLSGAERKQTSQSKPSIPRGNPQLHTQLQKFTLSADKTLSWLKDNVAMATQICCTASLDGFEAAMQCQAALEEEILSNRARIEVVKKEGRGLVRARHPGSMKIEEFLGQLEALWEELKRRHKRNALLLQESERLSLEATHVLVELDGLESWLQTVEMSIQRRSLAPDPEAVSAAERESSLLEREVSRRGVQLRVLHQEVDKLCSRRHFHTQQLPARLDQVEEKYRRVQCALTQQSSELQDTRMLTDFLERVELEESQEQQGSRYGDLRQALHRDSGSGASLLGLQGGRGGGGEPLMESMGDPVEQLREAVEMLNDTVRERGRSLCQEQGLRELLSRHSSLTVRIAQRLSRAAQLNVDIKEAESDMAVKCEPDRSGLEGLQEQQEELEIDCTLMKEEVEEMMKLAARLAELCPERVQVLGAEFQTTRQAWEELRTCTAENRARLRQFLQLCNFFRNYLAMISWTEDTRACIFSESAVHHGTGSEEPETSELDMKIQQKFEEFDVLAAAGQKLMDEEHHLTDMIRERMEELRSMLGWILVRWRSQKYQKKNGRKGKAEPIGDTIYSEATVSTTLQSDPQGPEETPTNQSSSSPSRRDATRATPQMEGGYEVMCSVGPRGGATSALGGALHTPASRLLLLKEPNAPSLGGTVNLILSFAKAGEDLQGEMPTEEVEEKGTEPLHRPVESHSSACKTFWRRCQGLLEHTFSSLKRKRKIYRHSVQEVSTYLHVTDNSKSAPPVGESITLLRPSYHALAPAPSSSSSSSSSPCLPSQSGPTSCHTLPRSTASSVFTSLKRRSKKRKRKRDVRRHTIQRIMGVEQPEGGAACGTHTWPLQERKRKEAPGVEHTDYLSNPLAREIDAECTGQSGFAPSLSACGSGVTPADPVRNCRYLSLGSVLSFDLQKDMSLIPCIPDVITIGLAEPARGTVGPHTERHAPLSTFKQTRPLTAGLHSQAKKEGSPLQVDCRRPQNTFTMAQCPPPPEIRGASMIQRQTTPRDDLSEQGQTRQSDDLSEQRPVTPNDDLLDLQLRRLSGISSLHEEVGQEWDKLVAVLDSDGPLHSQWLDPCQVKGQGPECSAPSVARVCSSVHTRIQHLSGHEHHPVKRQSAHEQARVPSPPVAHSPPPQPLTPESPDSPWPRRTTGMVVSLERPAGIGAPAGIKPGTGTAMTDAVRPDHQQFEEEEEELEDIWNQTNSYRQSICSDIMYQTYQGELASTPPGQSREPRSQDRARLYRKLVTASAPNLLVAELRLPTSDHTLLTSGREPSLRQKSHSAKPDRKSWATFLPQAPPSRQITLVNETAADLVKLPDTQDQEKYIYQYREEEEEEQEGVEAELGVEMDTSRPKAQSMSLLSVHMGLEEASRQPTGPDLPHSGRGEQGQSVSTGGHCSTTGRRLEVQSMEGILERKHRLQLGGKKAPCRAWSTSHAVLFRQTLCFYQDRKDTLRSSVSGLPLNLIGAECSPAPEYTKKSNCFSLRLCDGSEYLLSASSRFLMKKWLLKIQTNTGLNESDPYRYLSGPCVPEDLPLTITACHCGTKCHCPSKVKSTPSLSGSSHIGTVKGKEIVVLTRDGSQIPHWQHGNLKDLSPPLSSDAGRCEDYYSSLRQAMKQRLSQRPKTVHPSLSNSPEHPSSKRRSQSFTSATYQKITPVSLVPAAHGAGSSYSVTLVIGDHLSETTPASNGSEMSRLIGCGRKSFLDLPPERSYASLPRPRNKSVFRKFFGKKEWTHDL